jgi:pyridoxal phosphate enzyme (YggS family)
MEDIRDHLSTVVRGVENAAARRGRNPAEIEIMAVTKMLPEEAIDSALSAGITLFGENRVQEAMQKYPPSPRQYRLHLIGHLQRNKAKFVPGFFDCVESIDKIETAAALDRRCGEAGHTVDILLEYNTSGEESKSGFRTAEALIAEIPSIVDLPNLRLRGLMTIAPFTDDTSRIRAAFRSLRELFEQVRALVDSTSFDTLSMGMSSDYEIAVEEGATRIRVGSALFGSRRT